MPPTLKMFACVRSTYVPNIMLLTQNAQFYHIFIALYWQPYQVCLPGCSRNPLMSVAWSPAAKFKTRVYLSSLTSLNINFVASCFFLLCRYSPVEINWQQFRATISQSFVC